MQMNTIRDAAVILTDQYSWTAWYKQFQVKCDALKNWELVDPAQTIEPPRQPAIPEAPIVSEYHRDMSPQSSITVNPGVQTRSNSQQTTQGHGQRPATRASELSLGGQAAYRQDLEAYKLLLEAYKLQDKRYQDSQRRYEKLAEHIQSTVSPHLQLSCCGQGETVRQWVTSLRATVGIDSSEEQLQARDRYHTALKPMRAPASWETWLAEYDQATTRAEALQVPEVREYIYVEKDFLGAVAKVAPVWTTTFAGPGHDSLAMNRKKMMKLFRDHMSQSNPPKGKQKSAFAAGEASYHAGGEPDPGTQRDASSVAEVAPSANTSGNPRRKRKHDGQRQQTKSKQPSQGKTTAVGGLCPACRQRHKLSDCHYVFGEAAPDWFRPNRTVADIVQFRIETDESLQQAIADINPSTKRPRLSATPVSTRFKTSQTPDQTVD
jgi:hypothetical protein